MTNGVFWSTIATLDDLGYGSSLEVLITYTVNPAEPMVRYDRDGSGYPDCDASAELRGITVLWWSVGDEERRHIPDHWIWRSLTEIAMKIVKDKWESEFEDLCLEDVSNDEEE